MNNNVSNKKPGIIDPPLNVQDNFTLQTWMQQVTETLRQGVGQVGEVGQSFVTFDDLVQGGLLSATGSAQSYNRVYTSGSVAGGAYQGSSTGSESYDLTPPGKVSGVVLSALVGTVLIEWTPPSLSYPHYFEVWRSSTGNAADRTLIGTSRALRYTDVNVDDGFTYTYWVRVAKSVGTRVIYGSYDSDTGTAAIPRSTAVNILDIVGEDMYIKTPGGDINPFTYANLGTTEAPVWVVALRADVAIQGSLAISQLQSGELSPNAAFTLGNQSVVMDTRSDGSGQLIVSGDGGTQSNDYLVLNQGTMASYVWNGSEHVPYKEVRRIERGVASTGQQVTVPAWFKAQPTIYLSPFIIPTYNPDYPTQGQQWRLSHGNVEPNPNQAGGWIFTPLAQLELTDGNSTQVYPDQSYVGSQNDHEVIINNRTSLTSFKANIRLGSQRSSNTAGTWYNRQVVVTLWYRGAGTTEWLFGLSETVVFSQLNEQLRVMELALPSVANYDLRVTYSATDSGGTFTTAQYQEYEYRDEYVNAADIINNDIQNNESYTATRSINEPGLSGWELYNSTFSYQWGVYSSDIADAWLPSDASGGQHTVHVDYPTDMDGSNPPYGYKTGTTSFPINSNNSFTFKMTNTTNWGKLNITHIQGIYTYRRRVDATSNQFHLDSVEYDQGAQQINPTNETILINWLAVGE